MDIPPLAYFAGIIDGEGSIMLGKKRKVQRFRWPAVSVTSTTHCLVELCQRRFGGSISRQTKAKPHHKQGWVWQVYNDSALECLKKVVRHLQEPEKRRRAVLLLNEYKELTPRNGKYTKDMVAAKLDFERRFFGE